MLRAGFPVRFTHPTLDMAHILITSGPTRQYLDPVRYLTNASSGRMGAALAEAALSAGHQVTVVSGPVEVAYPTGVEVTRVVSTEEMLAAALAVFPRCDGLIAVAAPCDYRPAAVSPHKIRKSGNGLRLELVETPDIVAALAAEKTRQWLVAFALETEDRHLRAVRKLEAKSCDLIAVNGPAAIHAADTQVEILGKEGRVLASFSGPKHAVARDIFALIQRQLIDPA
jgi:phosphopantothenoylcysteine decarboxylase/phosphopantothenate--cysteine ligase